MRDQPAAAVDHEGLALLADLDLRDYVPDELQVHLGDADAGVTAGACHGERHVGFGFAAEIHRAVVDFLRHRFHELWVLGEIGADTTASIASRDTRSCSLPLASSWASSVMAGT